MPIQKFNLSLVDKTMITPTVMHLTFKREDGEPLDFVPGQFVTFMLEDVEGNVKRRSYSIATIPGQSNDIEIAISEVKGGIATETLFNLAPNVPLQAMGPAGKLVLQDEDIGRYILVGTGTGIAPYRAMLPALSQCCAKGIEVVILEGVQYQQDVLYAEDFVEFAGRHDNASFKACLSREGTSKMANHEVSGYVQHQFEQLNLNPEKDIVYLCGNPNMIDEAFAALTEQYGFDSKRVRREKYISSN